MLRKKTEEDITLAGKKIIMRVDFNVPLDADGNVKDDSRIRAALPTINYILEKGAALILMSHLGRPKGEKKPEFSLKPAFDRLKSLVSAPVKMAPDCIGPDAESAAAELKAGEILLLENLRYYKAETNNDPEFSKQLASLAEIYVNDAFGAAHRAHASTEGITKFMATSVAGFLMKKEIDYLENALEDPKRPFIAILGGAKVSDKIPVIERLLDKVDTLLIGGGMCFTFLKAQGMDIAASKLEEDRIEQSAQLLKLAVEKKKNLVLPVDVVAADKFDAAAATQTVDADKIPAGWMGLDIGPKSVELFSKYISECKTVVWNGPMGVFEMEAFAAGTKAVADAIAKNADCISIVGGGDSASAINNMGLHDKFTHISTGGGASLELLEGKALPGVEALNDK